MRIENRSVFKMVSLRGSIKGLTIDPNEYLDNETQILKRLSSFEFKPSSPTDEVKRFLESQHHLDELKLQALSLHAASKSIEVLSNAENEILGLKALQAISLNDSNISLSEYGASSSFQSEYSLVLDSWIILVLTDTSSDILPLLIRLLRVGAICNKLSKINKDTDTPNEILQLLEALVVFPRDWRQARFDRISVNKRIKERLDIISTLPTLEIDTNINNRKNDLETLTAKALVRETLLDKVNTAYWEFKATPVTAPGTTDDVGVTFKRSSPGPAISLNANYYNLLEQSITNDEQTELTEVKQRFGNRFGINSRGKLADAIGPQVAWGGARSACADIHVWEDEKEQTMPRPNVTGLGEEYAAIRSVGWGDLTIIREKLIGYDANEIAHIENILPGEKRFRENEKTYTTETFTETQTETVTESENELSTSNSQELQVQAKKTIDTDFSVSAGVNTSGRYGVTKVDTSLTADFQRSVSESRSSSTNLAKEVISKAVERTFESVRELRRTTMTQQMRELNRHEIDNGPVQGGDTPISQSGVYLWVEKIKELQLFHYGTRLMVEFHIPEPALSLLEQRTLTKDNDIKKPAPFNISPSFVTPATYQCLGKKYNVDGLEPPPPMYVSTGKGWNSMPDEGADDDKAEDVETLELKVPDGYYPDDGFVAVSIQTKHEAIAGEAQAKAIFFALSVGGIEKPIQFPRAIDPENPEPDPEVDNEDGSPINNSYEIDFDNAYPWPESTIPVNFRSHGQFDKTMYVQITVNCKRTPEYFTEWQLRTWEQIKSGHQVLVSNYEQQMRELEFATAELFETRGRPEKENRRVEREELQKWAIKIMRNKSFKFNAVEEISRVAEISALAANDQVEIVQFFEETFEWDYMSYILYPYFWGRRDAWNLRMDINDPDGRHLEFLKSGSCRVIVPITPGHEEQFLRYRDQSTDLDEIDRIRATVLSENTEQEFTVDTEFEDLWLELLLNKKEELARGSGTLSLTKNSNEVTINMEGDHGWELTYRDIGREVYILGNTYVIEKIISKNIFEMDIAYEGESIDSVTYAVGSVPYSSPWLVKLPTSHLILNSQKDKLSIP